jgi:hypothetical protein
MAHDVFISYSSADKPVADAVCAGLEGRGYRCWIAPRDIVPGLDWGAAIIDAITEARVMVLVFSSSANQSRQIKREVERAVAKGVSLIPLRIEDVPLGKTLEYFISSEHWMDALSRPLEPHIARLADAIKALLARPSRVEGARVDPTPLPAPLPAPPPPQPPPLPPPPIQASQDSRVPQPSSPRKVPRAAIYAGVALVATIFFFSLFARSPAPQILSVQFPGQIAAGGGPGYGTVFFKAPKSDIATARFDVVSAVNFQPFSFAATGVADRREGSVGFYVQSGIPQRVTLKATLVDRNGKPSNPVVFTFDVVPARAPATNYRRPPTRLVR